MKDDPSTRRHGDAYKFFKQETFGRRYGPEEESQAWSFFLAGWLAKARQADILRGKR